VANLVTTGANLFGMINSLSGQSNTQNTTDVSNLVTTGTTLIGLINSLSGIVTGNTGSFYPLHSNPSGYLTGINTGNFITQSQTGTFYPSSNPSGFITTETSFAANSGSYYPRSNPSGYITGVNTGNFVTTNNTGLFITTGQSGLFYPRTNPSGYITGFNSGNYTLNSNTGNFVTTGDKRNLGFLGNVGIGVSNPSHLLTVGSTAYINTDGSASLVQITSNNWGILPDGTAWFNDGSSNAVTINATASPQFVGAIDLNMDGSASFLNNALTIKNTTDGFGGDINVTFGSVGDWADGYVFDAPIQFNYSIGIGGYDGFFGSILNPDGSASFANGNLTIDTDGQVFSQFFNYDSTAPTYIGNYNGTVELAQAWTINGDVLADNAGDIETSSMNSIGTHNWSINYDGSAGFALNDFLIDANGCLSLNNNTNPRVAPTMIVYDSFGGGSTAFEINSNDPAGYGDYVQTKNNVLDNGVGGASFANGAIGIDTTNNRLFQKTPNGTKVYLHLTDPVGGVSTASWTTTP
jgi:hypothetical protein